MPGCEALVGFFGYGRKDVADGDGDIRLHMRNDGFGFGMHGYGLIGAVNRVGVNVDLSALEVDHPVFGDLGGGIEP